MTALRSRWLGLVLWTISVGVEGQSAVERLADADALIHDGDFRSAEALLDTVPGMAPTPAESALAAALAADIAIAVGQPGRAERLTREALAATPVGLDDAVRVRLLGTLGISLALQGAGPGALARLEQAAAAARSAGLPLEAARALSNAARVAIDLGQNDAAAAHLRLAAALAGELPASRAKAQLLIGIGRVHASDPEAGGDAGVRRSAAYDLYREAEAVARSLDAARLQSYAVGYTAELYRASGRFEDALRLFRQAAFLGQRARADEALYQWEWGSGRALEALGRADEARSSFGRAVALLEALRHQLPFFYGERGAGFERSIEPVYLDLVRSHLDHAQGADAAARQTALRAARDTVELLKAAELRNYFGDDCVERASERSAVDALAASALVVYPIPLADRLELLLTLPDGRLDSVRADVTAAALSEALLRWRALLEKRITREYLTLSQRLYGHLVRPFEGRLSDAVRTLVFVPYGSLGMVPMAALHDGERFLIERVAVAVTPGLELTAPAPVDRERLSLLLAGLGREVAGYPALSHVAAELDRVGAVGRSEVLLDEAFRRDRVAAALASEPFNVVHIATHGEFAGDTERSFLLAADGRVSMDDLERYVGLFRYRQQPLELLTLSACETAAGDRRSAMGLSGIAVKAGARSAVGTLWRVNDRSSALLMGRFYEALAEPGTSRAEALRQAQLGLLGDLRYRHPGYWSAFLLISNWL